MICWNIHLQIIHNFWNIVKAFNITKKVPQLSPQILFFFLCMMETEMHHGLNPIFWQNCHPNTHHSDTFLTFFTLNRVTLRHSGNVNNCSVGDSQVQSQSCYLAVWVLVVKICSGFLLCARILITLAARMHSVFLCFKRRLSWLEMWKYSHPR